MIRLGRVIPAIIFVVVVGAVCISYYHRSLLVRSVGREKQILPEDMSVSTEGFSFFQSDKGTARFEIKAKANLGFKNKKNLLESVNVKVFGKDGRQYDTISSDHCEYDQETEEIAFSGHVVVKLGQVGDSAGRPHKVESVVNDKVTTLTTESITYLKATGIAETKDIVHFEREGVHGTGRGLRYDSHQESIHLQSDVEITVDASGPQKAPIELSCKTLDYFKVFAKIEMKSKVILKQGLDYVESDLMTAWLRTADNSLMRVEALGNVRNVSRDPRVLINLSADNVTYHFNETGRWLEKVVARSNVKTESLDPLSRRDLSAEQLEILLKPNSNLLSSSHASGQVVLVLADYKNRKPASSLTSDSTSSDSQPANRGSQGDRRIRTPELHVTFSPDGKDLLQARASGPSTIEQFPMKADDGTTILSALSFHLLFGPSSHVEKLLADENVKVKSIAPPRPVRTTFSDHLDALVDRTTGQISQIHQFGHFVLVEEEKQAFADDARYIAATRSTLLRGHARMNDANSKTTAEVVEFQRETGLLKAQGNVRSVFENRKEGPAMAMFKSGSPVYASADSLEVLTNRGIATYYKRARLWQDDQVLNADTIVLCRDEKKLRADSNVHTMFYTERAARSGERNERKPANVYADHLLYEDAVQRAVYSRNVRMTSSMGVLESNELEIFIGSTGEKEKSVERMLATGNVRIQQPGRLATSESAEFFQLEKKVVLTGGMPRILDSERGSTSGARLTLFFDDGSISVVGTSENRSLTRQRVAR